MSKVLVTGATGNVGRNVVAALRARGVLVRAFTRNADRVGDSLGDGVEVAVGDFDEVGSLRQAMQGVDALFLTSADGPQKVDHENAVIDAAAAAWVPRIVKLSNVDPAVDSPLEFSRWHGEIEEHLRTSGTAAVVLRANFFMSNLLANADAIRHTGQLFAPAGDAKIAMIDPRDVAAAAAIVLTRVGHEGQTYHLTGPEAITYRDIADQLSAATGRSIRFVDVPDEAARAGLLETGAPNWLADNLVNLFGLMRQGLCSETTDAVRDLTGQPPRTFATFARDHAADFRP